MSKKEEDLILGKEVDPEIGGKEEDADPDDYDGWYISEAEYIASAFNALAAVDGIDSAMLTGEDKKRVKRIQKKALRILDHNVGELYGYIFEKEDEDED
jgi:hypothetical protein